MDLVSAGTALVVGKKLLGKTFDVISSDIAQLYEKGRDKIIEKASKKTENTEDGKTANLRITRDVFWNGSFTEEAICAEYFGGILAASRSEDGKNDSGIYYVDLIKSLSSNQLKLHYLIYSSLNKILVANPSKKDINPGQESELVREKIFLSANEIRDIIGEEDFGKDLHALHAKGLIGHFGTGIHELKNGQKIPKLEATPKPLGIQLYAIAHNKFDKWREYPVLDFGSFEDIKLPQYSGQNINELLTSAGIKEEN